jgi:hypothetical protein
MRNRSILTGLAAVALLTAASGSAQALNKRVEVVQQGDFILIGNTLAHDCAMGLPQPKTGSVMCPASGVSDKAPDIFWRAENGTANATTMITVDQAQTAAELKIPDGATVTHAFLYWSARKFQGADNSVVLQCLGAQGMAVSASNSLTDSDVYHSGADITSYVQTNGSCTYFVSGVDSVDFKGANDLEGHSAWWMVILYSHPKEPHRHLAVYDGVDGIAQSNTGAIVSNLLVPNNFTKFSKAKVGVVAYDGDRDLIGDSFLVIDPQTMVKTKVKDTVNGNPDDFFNSTRTYLGIPIAEAGDLPGLLGTPGSMMHLDMDVVDVTDLIKPGQTELSFEAQSVEPVFVGGLITSVPTFTDEDKDGLSDDEEVAEGTDPKDADSDNDGVLDGEEGCSMPMCADPGWNIDSDGDGLINALDPDSDNDGLFDGTELGLDCNNPATDKTLGHCIADGDIGATKTDPLDDDTDDGGVLDGAEDVNLNGSIDEGELDPTTGHGDDDANVIDSDGDGLSDGLEDTIGSNNNDADSDDDGLLDGDEANPADDTDGDGLPDVIDVDSDNDGLFDGTETGKGCDDPATSKELGHCRADQDPSTTTAMVDADTDDGGVIDGAEDGNLDGKLDPGELDPTEGHPTDDGTIKDQDGDGLSDDLEIFIGSDPGDKDSDDDGVPDGEEANLSDDTDGDGKINIFDEDSDGDDLYDGTEGGYGCSGPGTDKTANHCIPDGDKGKTKTSMVDADTDNGGVPDGVEDFDKDGVYDATQNEGNPLDPSDDSTITSCRDDSQCGTPNDGSVCDTSTHTCVPACKDLPTEGCPENQTCVLESGNEIGYCKDDTSASGDPYIIYDGCICILRPTHNDRGAAWALLVAGAAAAVLRRRMKTRSQ